jgi:hypothetical protein
VDEAFPNLSDHWVVLMIHEHGIYDIRSLMVLSVGDLFEQFSMSGLIASTMRRAHASVN